MKQDRIVVITGAAGGMGAVLVDRFLANGDTVVATDAKPQASEEAWAGRGAKCITAAADVSKAEAGVASSTSAPLPSLKACLVRHTTWPRKPASLA